MGEQGGNVGVGDHMGGDAAEENLAQARMTVGAHDQQIGALPPCRAQQ